MMADALHTLLTKGMVQMMAIASVALGLSGGVVAASWWPSDWPMALQVVLAVLIAELGLYWSHRLAHEWPPLWRFHALHHSVERLWFWNTGRFHVIDTLQRLAFAVPLLWLAGAPA